MLVHDGQGGGRLEETKRIARVLRIVHMISAQPRVWTRRRLSQELEIGERMIDKDAELIRHGLCFDLRHSPDGYYFERGPLLKPVEMSAPEALALALAAQQARDTGTVDAAVIGGVLAKIEAATLALLKQAMAEGRRVEIVYVTASRGGRARSGAPRGRAGLPIAGERASEQGRRAVCGFCPYRRRCQAEHPLHGCRPFGDHHGGHAGRE